MSYAILGPRRASGVAYNIDKLTNHSCNNTNPGGDLFAQLVTGAKPRVSLRFRRADRDSG